jgi:hypothetical protein
LVNDRNMSAGREMEQIRGYMVDEETRESVGTEEDHAT